MTRTTTGRGLGQRRAAGLLRRILIHHAGLPPLIWTIHNAGCELLGSVTAADPAVDVREVHAEWCTALGIRPQPERVASPSATCLVGTGLKGGVQVTITALIHTEGGS